MQRPTVATVFGVLNILYGGLSLLGSAFSWWVMYLEGAEGNPVSSLVQASAFYSVWVRLTMFLGVIAAILVVASGIGLLKMARWARVAAVGYSWYSISMMFVGGVMGWFFVYSPLLDEITGAQGSEQKGMLIGGLVGGLFGGCFALIYPVALLYFMTRPGLVSAFEGTSTPELPVSTPTPTPPVANSEPVVETWDPYTPPKAPVQARSEPSRDTGDDVLATIVPFRNKPALASYYLGLFSLASLIPILGLVGVGMAIAAFFLGIKGRRLAMDHPEAKGTAHAWVGILGGAFWGVLGILMQAIVLYAIVAR